MINTPLPSGHVLRRLDADDLPALLALHEDVIRALPEPGMFRLFGGPRRFLSDHFGARGESLGLFAGERLAAYGSLTRPQVGDKDNYAGDLGWEPARAGRVALLSAAMVDPSQRGQGLHPALVAARIQLAREHGHDELLVRAAPTNAQSRRTLLAHGFAVVWVGIQAEGSLRHVMWRRVGGPVWQGSAVDVEALAWAAADDFALQQQLLADGWIGVHMLAGDTAIGFARTARVA